MNKYLLILLAFFFINGLGSLTTYLVPSLPKNKVLPIILWLNMLLFLALFLPSRVASFLSI
tara:strand:+ start:2078 stop:2260 length:183 start_codon:yes stop_codon:yes gene_type:complete